MYDPYYENRVKINPRTSNGLSRIVSGSVCNRCQNRGWVLPSDGKILVTERYDALSGLMMPEPAYVQESERMIKCDCGR